MLNSRGSRIISVLFLFVSTAILSAQVRASQQPQMVLLGTGRVNNGPDRDTIQTGQQGTFRAIQLRVNGGP